MHGRQFAACSAASRPRSALLTLHFKGRTVLGPQSLSACHHALCFGKHVRWVSGSADLPFDARPALRCPAAPGEAYEFNAAACARRALKNKALVGARPVVAVLPIRHHWTRSCSGQISPWEQAAVTMVPAPPRWVTPRLQGSLAPGAGITRMHVNCGSPLCILQGYLASLGDPAVTDSLLRRFQEATNMTDEISALAALDRAGECMPGLCEAASGGFQGCPCRGAWLSACGCCACRQAGGRVRHHFGRLGPFLWSASSEGPLPLPDACRRLGGCCPGICGGTRLGPGRVPQEVGAGAAGAAEVDCAAGAGLLAVWSRR